MLEDLERAQAAIFEAEAMPDIEDALGEIERLYPWLQWCASEIRHEMSRRDYDPATRFEAAGMAIRTLKVQIGRCP